MKKLYGQFTEDEKEMINTILHGINTKSVRITFHTRSRMKEKDISFKDLFGVFTNYQIIELHEKDGDIRVLLRGNKRDALGRNTCCSYSVSSNTIITTYKNSFADNHYTLDCNNYINTDISKLLKPYYKIN